MPEAKPRATVLFSTTDSFFFDFYCIIIRTCMYTYVCIAACVCVCVCCGLILDCACKQPGGSCGDQLP